MPYNPYLRPTYPNELYHHGIKGQKWGVRRFQNPDASLEQMYANASTDHERQVVDKWIAKMRSDNT